MIDLSKKYNLFTKNIDVLKSLSRKSSNKDIYNLWLNGDNIRLINKILAGFEKDSKRHGYIKETNLFKSCTFLDNSRKINIKFRIMKRDKDDNPLRKHGILYFLCGRGFVLDANIEEHKQQLKRNKLEKLEKILEKE